jgi:hypothetical protein
MSYSVEKKCEQCDLEDKCVDRFFLEGAVSGIHSSTGYSAKTKAYTNRGHLGAGVIKLDCSNFVQQPPKQKIE